MATAKSGKVIISCAITGSIHTPTMSDALPITPDEIATQAIEAAAPPWSAACMTDHGPSDCGEPMWVYGSPRALSRYRDAF